MRRTVLLAKLHGIRVTGADLHYEGSIQLDPDHIEAAGLISLEFVEVWNKTTGARLSTCVIPGERGSRSCVLNGAAARTCQPGDELIIAATVSVTAPQLARLRCRILVLGDNNDIRESIEYFWTRDGDQPWTMQRAGAESNPARELSESASSIRSMRRKGSAAPHNS